MSVARFSPHHPRKKSAIVRLSFRRRSYEGDEMTEMTFRLCFADKTDDKFSWLGEVPVPAESGPEAAVFDRRDTVGRLLLPTYPTTMFGENDGDGVSPVLYLKIFDSFDKEISPRLKDSIKETKKVKGFPGDNIVPYTERLKILAGIINPEDLQLSTLKTFRSRCCLDPSTSSTRDPLSASFIDSDPLCHWNDLDSAIVTSPRVVSLAEKNHVDSASYKLHKEIVLREDFKEYFAKFGKVRICAINAGNTKGRKTIRRPIQIGGCMSFRYEWRSEDIAHLSPGIEALLW
uniref:Uncharacterized protein n=1 Tax=Aegilops tauschii TaxID=37682 RepID=M8D2Z5_AEGTA